MSKKVVIKRIFPKEDLEKLETVTYNGEIHVIDDIEEAEKAIAYLKIQKKLGIDTETKPVTKKGEKLNEVALIQIATKDKSFLFRINKIGFLPSIINLLEDKNIKKIGLALKNDFKQLKRLAPLTPNNIIDLEKYVNYFRIENKGLQRIYAILFNQNIDKSQCKSNWEANTLSPEQEKYAAIDAYVCIKIYDYLENLKKTGNFKIEMVDEGNKEKEELPIEDIHDTVEILNYSKKEDLERAIAKRMKKKKIKTINYSIAPTPSNSFMYSALLTYYYK